MIKINREFGVKRTLIKAFGSFILLSYVKVLNPSVDILMPVQVYNASGIVVGVYTYYNASLEYFGREHLPYAFLAIFMFATFNLAPFLLLCLYPCRCFQSCLNCCRHIFNHKYYIPFSYIIAAIGLFYPAIYASVLIIYSIMPKSVKVRVKQYFKKFTLVNHGRGDGTNEDALLEVGEENDDKFC